MDWLAPYGDSLVKQRQCVEKYYRENKLKGLSESEKDIISSLETIRDNIGYLKCNDNIINKIKNSLIYKTFHPRSSEEKINRYNKIINEFGILDDIEKECENLKKSNTLRDNKVKFENLLSSLLSRKKNIKVHLSELISFIYSSQNYKNREKLMKLSTDLALED